MFGMKLKSWMEAHLGRPKTSKANANNTTTAPSSHHSNKKASNNKEVAAAVLSPSQQPTPPANSSSSAFSDSSSNSADILHVGNSGVSSSVSSGTSQGTVNILQQQQPSCSSSSTNDRDNGTEGHNNSRNQEEGESSSNNCVSRPSQSNNNLNNSGHSGGILLGGSSVGVFNTNNLSSPDTGYSTDGYSPKSVYPALSFESSGKSTPKSSYTISSLVSSELLHNSSCSASCSSSSKVLPTTTGSSLFASLAGSGSVSIHVHLDGLEKKMVEVVERRTSSSSPGKSRENEILMEGPSNNATQQHSSIKGSGGRSEDNDSVKKKPSPPNEPSFHQYSHDKESPQRLQTTNPFRETPSSSSSSVPVSSSSHSSYSQLNKNSSTASNHLIIESSPGDSSSSSSSKAPKLRTLAGTSLTSDSKSSLPGYSISSPRKERTKIKTNPWLPIFPHSNISNGSHANSIVLGKSTNTTKSSDDDGLLLHSPVKCRGVSCGEETAKESSGDERLLRVSSTSGGSDSGKGSLGTNRNSTESSVLLTDSPRNSIISHETPQDSADDTNNTPSPTAHQQSHPGPHSRWTSSQPPPPSTLSSQQPSATCPSSASSSRKKKGEENEVKRIVTMVDKETDILSDWAGTDEDDEDEDDDECEDEDEGNEGHGEETEEGPATPTPSTPTDCRVPGGRSSSSDIDFGDSSAATYSGVSCSIQQQQMRSASQVESSSSFFHHQPNIIKVFPKNNIPPGVGGGGIDSSNSSFFPIQQQQSIHHHSQLDKRILNSPPVATTAGIHPSIHHYSPFTGLVYSDPSIDSDYLNANILGDSAPLKSPPSSSSSSQALARGALGFLRKIFRKTSSCSSQRPNSPGSDRGVRMRFRKERNQNKDETLEDFVPMRSPLLTAATDSLLLSPHPLVGRRNPLHPHHTFLTPTPNAFRRRSGGGGGSSGESGESGKTSSSSKSGLKNLKPVKTDIIRLLPSSGPASRPIHTNNTTSASSTGTTSSSENKGGVFCVSTLLENPYEGAGGGGGVGDGPAGNSSGSSSLHSMSTSVSANSGNNGNHSNRNNQSSSSHHHRHHQPMPSAGFPFQETLLHNQRDPNNKGQFHSQGIRDFIDPHHPLNNHNRGHQGPPPPAPPMGMNYSSPPFNNSYSPIHRLVVTSSSSPFGHPSSASPLTPPRSSGMIPPPSSFHPPPPQMVMSTFTPTPHHNRPHNNPQTFSPSANHHQHHLNQRPPSSCAETFVSPSPILGNPRYQFIPSSNQNSPMLNVHKRQPAPTYPHPPPSSNAFSSPIPPPRTSNLHPLNPFVNNGGTPSPHFNGRRGSVSGCPSSELAIIPQNNINSSNNLPSNRVNVLSRSHSYQQQQLQQQNQQQQQHYYASPHHQRPPLPPQQQQQQPLLMRTHLHNQNIRLNNFLMNKQRSSSVKISGGGINSRPKNSQSFHERIYESVDSEDEDDCGGDEEEGNEVDDEDEEYDEEEADCRRRLGGAGDQPIIMSRPPPPPRMKRPPVPMALFGPNTFLSETETRLLEADREADRKYKRLINEAEALLREISAVKSQQIQQQSKRHHHHQPWVNKSHHEDRFQMEECPQSDPLRRKAYDCWALRRLQQELAGCCASPPVLHRSRMNLQSPSTPTGNNGGLQPYPVGLSLISHHNNETGGASSIHANNNTDNRANGHF